MGWKGYLDYLGWLNANEPEKKRLEFDRISKDWALGTGEFKRELIALHQRLEKTSGCGEAGPRECEQQLWEERITAYLAALDVSRIQHFGPVGSSPSGC